VLCEREGKMYDNEINIIAQGETGAFFAACINIENMHIVQLPLLLLIVTVLMKKNFN
jgi:hypothetical protein